MEHDRGIFDCKNVLPAEKYYTWQIEDTVKIRDIPGFPPITVPNLLEQCCRKYGEKAALAFKKNGQWRYVSYREYYQNVQTIGKALLKLGLRNLETVSILGCNDPRWFYANLGVIMAGGCASGIYPTNSPAACLYCLKSTNARIVIVENDEQLQKIRQIRNQVASIKWIIQFSGKPTDPSVLSWDTVMEIGTSESNETINVVVDSLVVNRACTLVFTSATTGDPKIVQISHDNLTFIARTFAELSKAENGVERIMSCFPLNHMMAQSSDIYLSMVIGACTFFADKNSLKGMNIIKNLRSVRPTMYIASPRIFEKIQEHIENFEKSKSSSMRRLINTAKATALEYHTNTDKKSDELTLAYRLFQRTIFKQVKRSVGLNQCKLICSGAAPLSQGVRKYLASLDIAVGETYGMSECCGPHFIFKGYYADEHPKGLSHSVMKTMIENPDEYGEGEVCIWGRHVFMGYSNEAEKTKNAIDENGWLRTGDRGSISDHYIRITGRIKEIIITSGGENVSPLLIEQKVKTELPIVSHAVLIGDRRKYLSVLITLKCIVNEDTGIPTDTLAPETRNWCRRLGCEMETLTQLIKVKPREIYEAVEDGISKVNSTSISRAQRIQKFVILPRDFSSSSGELGPTMKLRRPSVHANFKEFIDSMYLD